MSSLRIPDAIDLHCHFGPDTVGGLMEDDGRGIFGSERGLSALDAVREAAGSGHAGIVLKSHSFPSGPLAANLEQAVPGIRVIGGMCIGYPVGGLNVAAVEAALAVGTKVVWLPTVDSHQAFLHGSSVTARPNVTSGIKVLDDEGRLLPEVREIFELIRENGAVLATGHITAQEHYEVVREFAGRGRVLITHAGEELAGPNLDGAQAAELADLGAVVEFTALTCHGLVGMQAKDSTAIAGMIRTVGVSRSTLSTDYGWFPGGDYPRPVAGLQDFLEQMWSLGFSETELTELVSRNPARLLELGVAGA